MTVHHRTLSAVTSFVFGPRRRHSHSHAVVAVASLSTKSKTTTVVEHNNNNSDANEYFLDSGGSSNTQTPAHASLSSTFTPRQSWRASTNSRGRSGGGKAAAVDQNRGDNDVTRRLSWMPPNSYSSTTDNLNHNSNSSSLPLLRDLLQQKEIFAKSWSEPDRREIRRRRRDGDDFVYDNYYHVNTTTRRQRGIGGDNYDE